MSILIFLINLRVSNEQIEERLCANIESEIELRIARDKSGESISPDPLERILGQVANMVYFGKILNTERLKKYIGYYDIYDLVVWMERFDYNNKFKIDWLTRFNQDYIEKISRIDSAKAAISGKLEQEIIGNDELDKKIKEIYFKWFM